MFSMGTCHAGDHQARCFETSQKRALGRARFWEQRVTSDLRYSSEIDTMINAIGSLDTEGRQARETATEAWE